MKRLALCLIATFLNVIFIVGQSPIADSNEQGLPFNCSGRLATGIPVSVEIVNVGVNEDSFPFFKPLRWGGLVDNKMSIISKINVQINGIDVWVRFSAYSDLSDINSVDLIILEDSFQVSIDGSQSSSHYKADLFFSNDGQLEKRNVYSATFPDEVWESTIYSFIQRKDM